MSDLEAFIGFSDCAWDDGEVSDWFVASTERYPSLDRDERHRSKALKTLPARTLGVAVDRVYGMGPPLESAIVLYASLQVIASIVQRDIIG